MARLPSQLHNFIPVQIHLQHTQHTYGPLPIHIFVIFAIEQWPFALVWSNSGLEVTTNFN